MLTKAEKNDTKVRIKDNFLKKWGRTLEEELPEPQDRLKIYDDIWNLRDNNVTHAKVPNAVIIAYLSGKFGHWRGDGKGIKVQIKK